MLIKLTEIEGDKPRDVFYNPDFFIRVVPGEDGTTIYTTLFAWKVKETPDEIKAKIAEQAPAPAENSETLSFDLWRDAVDENLSHIHKRITHIEKHTNWASAPVTSDIAQEAREVLQMIADADTGTIQVDIDDEIASSDCRHCEWMKERAKEYLESHPAPVESHPCDTKPVESHQAEELLRGAYIEMTAVNGIGPDKQYYRLSKEAVDRIGAWLSESHQPAGDEAKWPEDMNKTVSHIPKDSTEPTMSAYCKLNGVFLIDNTGNLSSRVFLADDCGDIDFTIEYLQKAKVWLRARQGGTV